MMTIIRFMKKDFKRTRVALDSILNRNVPLWIFVIYYAILAPIGILLLPFGMLYLKRITKLSWNKIFEMI